MALTPGTRFGPYEIAAAITVGGAASPKVIVVLNWLDELKHLVPTD